MKARFCSPVLGRFLGVDRGKPQPEDPLTWNRYAYVTGNPLKYQDPDGRERAQILLDTDVKEYLRGQITAEQYQARINARGVGAVVGAAAGFGVLAAAQGALASSALSAAIATRGLLVRVAPVAASPALQKVVDQLFKVGDRFPGGTAGALRIEAATGQMLSRSLTGHAQAGLERLGNLSRVLQTGGLDSRDVGTALKLQRDLKQALELALGRLGFTSKQIADAIATGKLPTE